MVDSSVMASRASSWSMMRTLRDVRRSAMAPSISFITFVRFVLRIALSLRAPGTEGRAAGWALLYSPVRPSTKVKRPVLLRASRSSP